MSNNTDRKSFVFYFEWVNAIRDLPNDVRLEIYDAITEYAQSGKLPSLKPFAKIAFTFIQGDLDRDLKKYLTTVERNRENIKKRWSKDYTKNTTGKNGIPKDTKNTDNNDNNNNDDDDDDNNENENENKNEKKYRSFAHLSISVGEVKKLEDAGYSMTEIDEVLDAVENYKNNKNYTSLYLTANNWLKKRREQQKSKTTGFRTRDGIVPIY